ncbi:MAG: dihydrolipoyl dehydrogenase [Gammaproteobacteria bacterium]|nr:dihydrolipoyl dehydrogenase [Gammaproteobacteria bacterium]
MGQFIEIRVPEDGNVTGATVIEITVNPGDSVQANQSLIMVETSKAAIDIPSPAAGVITEIRVAIGDKVSAGAVILLLDTTTQAHVPVNAPGSPSDHPPSSLNSPAPAPSPMTAPTHRGDIHAEVVVLGAGPGGYTAAFRAADLGRQVVLIEKHAALGGVCLNVGCIPSKALLHVARVINEAEEISPHGVAFGRPVIDLDRIRDWKEDVVGRLTGGLAGLARQRKVRVMRGTAQFVSPNSLLVQTAEGEKIVTFDNAVVAAGSSVARIPGLPYDDPRLIDSTGALALQDVPQRMLIIGGGIIGLEMATVYDALGSRITVVELADGLIPGADRDLVRPLHKRIEQRYEAIHLKTRVAGIEPRATGLLVSFAGDQAPEPQIYDRVLLAAGRRPNGRAINAEAAGLIVDERGFIPVDRRMRTNVPHIYAIGDIVGEPMLAHKAVHEGKVAAENIAGHASFFEPATIPAVAYTDPEIAWMGLTETQARAQGIAFEKASFPWAASGRALSIARGEGTTKVLLDPDTRRLLGAGIVGANAGELIAEAMLALEAGMNMQDIGLTIHPHPTLSETLGFAAEMAEGTITDLLAPRKRH